MIDWFADRKGTEKMRSEWDGSVLFCGAELATHWTVGVTGSSVKRALPNRMVEFSSRLGTDTEVAEPFGRSGTQATAVDAGLTRDEGEVPP